jgi:UDP-N-acetylglucosamine 3-dehydrogenase
VAKPIRIAVIGTGGWGKNHLRVFSELGALACLCDTDAERARAWSEKYDCRAYASLDQMLASEELDAVTVCTPTTTHFEVASKVLKQGLHAFVEKPMTATSIEGRQLIEIAKNENRFLTVGFIERFNPALRDAKEAINSKELGEPLLLEFHRENRWEGRITDVGIIPDTSVHDIDSARWLLDEEPSVVYARAGKVLSDKREDFAVITLGFEDKKSAFIMSNWVTPKRLRRMSAVCTKGVISLDFITQETRFDDSDGTRIPRRDYAEPLMQELRAFVESIRAGKQPLVTPNDGLNNTIVAEAALASSKTGDPIYLNLD